MKPSGSRRRERLATSLAEYVVESEFFCPITSRRASLKKPEVSGSSMAMPMRTRCPGPAAGGNRQAGTQGLIVPVECRWLAGGEKRPDRLARELQDRFARLRRGKLHRQDAVLVLDGEQLGGRVHDVLRGRRNASTRGKARRGRSTR